MARRIKFFSPDNDIVLDVKNHVIDVVKSYTVIFDETLFSRYRIFDEIDNIDIDQSRIRVNYSTGAYLLITHD
jgi:hypothetical protein